MSERKGMVPDYLKDQLPKEYVELGEVIIKEEDDVKKQMDEFVTMLAEINKANQFKVALGNYLLELKIDVVNDDVVRVKDYEVNKISDVYENVPFNTMLTKEWLETEIKKRYNCKEVNWIKRGRKFLKKYNIS